MANINLNSLIKPTTNIKSNVRNDIVLNKSTQLDIIYSDLQLDIELGEVTDRDINSTNNTNDLKCIINEEVILTSLRNILNTMRFSRLLNPELNMDLRRYLFNGLSEGKAYFIGYDICTQLTVHEPRIVIENVSIDMDYNEDLYNISLRINIPSLDKVISLKGILDNDGLELAT